MFCSNCGKEIPDESVFCPECGYAVYEDDVRELENIHTDKNIKEVTEPEDFWDDALFGEEEAAEE
ncbi:MAG: zinc ribbon domain-containing protein, partial [Clostridia bacterium]|nr:zinc ribbon domain-containing protein [Clostridia bacterium]